MIGETISHYRILEKLGQGGMGAVYLADDSKLGRRVALKFLEGATPADSTGRVRLIREAQAAAALDHSGICTVYEIGEAEGRVFIAMAYIEGRTLAERITEGPLPTVDAIAIAAQVADALAHAHAHGIVHRDIKPQNIMLSADGRAQITDFGLALADDATRVTQADSVVGTPAYMSPEQASGGELGPYTDLWALGTVLYEMLAGRLPFRRDSAVATLHAILNEEPTPLAELRADLPAGLDALVHRALAKAPVERYGDAGELLADLQNVEAGAGIRHRPARAKRRGGRLRALLAAGGLTAVLATIGLWIFWPEQAIPFAERDWIIIADFENFTGEEVFDKSLDAALGVSIGQSKFVNVFPPRRLQGTLRRMKKPEDSPIDEKLGSEVAVREGIKLILVPSISRVGGRYAVMSEIQEAATGRTLRSEMVRSADQDGLLDALDKLSGHIREDLGETLPEISERSRPLIEVTTSSLEALKEFAVANEHHRAGRLSEAKVLYESALRIDSTFVAARASLGIMHFEYGHYIDGFDQKRGTALLASTITDVDALTEREKHSVLAFHARAVEGDPNKALSYHRALLDLYPDDAIAHNNVGRVLFELRRYEETVETYKEALRLDPTLGTAFHGLIFTWNWQLVKPESSLVWCRRRLDAGEEDAWLFDHIGTSYLALDSLSQARIAFERSAEMDQTAPQVQYRLGHTLRLMGDYTGALHTLDVILRRHPNEHWAHVQRGHIHRLLGNEQAARRDFEQFHGLVKGWLEEDPDNWENRFALALVRARLGEPDDGWLASLRENASTIQEHMAVASLLSIGGQVEGALDQLELAVQKGYRNYIWLKIDPEYQWLHGEPRFQALLRQLRQG